MNEKAKKVWVCGCGESNTEQVCKSCGEPKADRKEFSVCPKCNHVYFSETHTCKE